MTVKELEKRIAALEVEVRDLRARVAATPAPAASEPAWLKSIGLFADDPTFEEAVRIGREWRDEINRQSLEEFDREEAARAAAGQKKPRKRPANARA